MTRALIQGAVGLIEVDLTLPEATMRPHSVAVICHPHPLYGGTMDNKVVTTLARTYRQVGIPAVRFQFRGVGQSAGEHDHAVGEVEDALAVMQWAIEQTDAHQLWLAGFSFGAYVAAAAAMRWTAQQDRIPLAGLYLVAPPTERYPMETLTLPAYTQVVAAGADEVVSTPLLLAWATRHQLQTVTVPEASHFFDRKLPLMAQPLQEQLAAAQSSLQ